MPPDPSHDRVRVVLVTAANRGDDSVEEVRRLLAAAGLGHARVDAVPVGSALDAALDTALDTRPDLLVVGGGDGALGTAAGKVAGTVTVLGVLPLGTTNDFARTCRIPGGLEEAVRTLSTGTVVDVDLGRARAFGPGTAAVSRPFLNLASTGLSVGVTRRISPRLEQWLGPLAQRVATLSAYYHHEPFSARLEFPDGDHPTLELDDLLQVTVGTGRRHGAGDAASPGASVGDHTLDVCAITRGRRDQVSIARLMEDGRLVEHDRVHHLRTPRVRVHTSTPQPFELDGEVTLGAPVDFRVERDAVHVVVPRAGTVASYDGRRAA